MTGEAQNEGPGNRSDTADTGSSLDNDRFAETS